MGWFSRHDLQQIVMFAIALEVFLIFCPHPVLGNQFVACSYSSWSKWFNLRPWSLESLFWSKSVHTPTFNRKLISLSQWTFQDWNPLGSISWGSPCPAQVSAASSRALLLKWPPRSFTSWTGITVTWFTFCYRPTQGHKAPAPFPLRGSEFC